MIDKFKIKLFGLLKRTSFLFSDMAYIKIMYRLTMNKHIDFKNCRTMNEKLQYLKIYNRYPLLTQCVDKIDAKDVVAKMIGQEYINPTIKIWNSVDEITKTDLDSLPNKFVVKTNHSGGNTGVEIVKDKSVLDVKALKQKMALSLKGDIYKSYREWPYKNVQKRIFAEQYLGEDLIDYKFYCFNGNADVVLLCVDRNKPSKTKFYFFDKKWELKRYNKAGKEAPEDFTLPKPAGMDKMFELASKLSMGFPFVRVDFYNVNGKIYFGELTFYPASGIDNNRLYEADLYFGNKIDLSLARVEK